MLVKGILWQVKRLCETQTFGSSTSVPWPPESRLPRPQHRAICYVIQSTVPQKEDEGTSIAAVVELFKTSRFNKTRATTSWQSRRRVAVCQNMAPKKTAMQPAAITFLCGGLFLRQIASMSGSVIKPCLLGVSHFDASWFMHQKIYRLQNHPTNHEAKCRFSFTSNSLYKNYSFVSNYPKVMTNG